MRILAIDPGTTQSAWVLYAYGEIVNMGLDSNDDVLSEIDSIGFYRQADKLYIEMVASYGMAVGKTVFETCVWIGRFIQKWVENGGEWEFVYRKDVKMHLCGQTKAKDANIRQAIMDLYGSDRSVAIGTKSCKGPLYGVSKDIWAALGVAITASA